MIVAAAYSPAIAVFESLLPMWRKAVRTVYPDADIRLIVPPGMKLSDACVVAEPLPVEFVNLKGAEQLMYDAMRMQAFGLFGEPCLLLDLDVILLSELPPAPASDIALLAYPPHYNSHMRFRCNGKTFLRRCLALSYHRADRLDEFYDTIRSLRGSHLKHERCVGELAASIMTDGFHTYDSSCCMEVYESTCGLSSALHFSGESKHDLVNEYSKSVVACARHVSVCTRKFD